MRLGLVPFWLLALLLLWLTHAIGFFSHEYAHSFTAWLLHDKANPLALYYGHIDPANIVFQADIDENVDYAPIFAAGHGRSASLIAVAGVLIGNGAWYIVSRLLYAKARENGSRAWAMFFFLLCVMSAGNFLAYVPIRTFTGHADMATVAKGLHISPWVIAIFLGLPFAIAIWHLFARILPEAKKFLFTNSIASQWALTVLTSWLIFGFFGGAGIRNYGIASHWLSIISEFVLFPAVTAICLLHRTRESSALSSIPLG